jgi:hypothetical protein
MWTELLTEPLHVRIKRTAVGGIAITPHHAQKIVPVLWFAGTLAEEQKQLELGGGELGGLVLDSVALCSPSRAETPEIGV